MEDASTDARAAPPADSAAALPADALVLAQRLEQGDRRALARAISYVENGDAIGQDIVRNVYPRTGSAHLLGVTGPPGVGKSSLVGAMVRQLRADRGPDEQVGIISVDPSSPFTQGALLGDRIRLTDHFLDRRVFIRSMGTRGHLGGLAEASLQSALLLDAFGSSEIFLETVGVGQSEIEIARIADTIVLVLMPGSGDAVQALKAGVMEIPDIIVINKADHPMARTLHNEVRSILQLGDREWAVPIVETEAIRDEGIAKLWERISEHRAHLALEGRLEARRRSNLESEVLGLASSRSMRHLQARVHDDPRLRDLLDAMHRRELDPLTCTQRIYREVFQQ